MQYLVHQGINKQGKWLGTFYSDTAMGVYLRFRIDLHADQRIWNACQYKIIVVTGFTTELHAGRQRVHFLILQPFLLTTYGNNRRLEDIVSDK